MTDGHRPSASALRALDRRELRRAANNLEDAATRLAVAVRMLSTEHDRLDRLPEVRVDEVLEVWRATLSFVQQVMPDIDLRVTEAVDTLRDAGEQIEASSKPEIPW